MPATNTSTSSAGSIEIPCLQTPMEEKDSEAQLKPENNPRLQARRRSSTSSISRLCLMQKLRNQHTTAQIIEKNLTECMQILLREHV
ncbi:hypothetical protein CHS0354_032399 [Potamilus streckersoni]|uniref:Uncharacterized protein n=1 Tax=Potamilus streckersoni TaxID=2493646 RepID=A0AAE0TGM4_9BIVA|nr:hypothetical protein CHS0354_032399 [Potamilus streckersoni]